MCKRGVSFSMYIVEEQPHDYYLKGFLTYVKCEYRYVVVFQNSSIKDRRNDLAEPVPRNDILTVL
jgi:hypothetical protein